MKIKEITPYLLFSSDTETGKGHKNVGGYTGYQVLVKIDTDEGITGWGESCVNSENGEGPLALHAIFTKGISPKLIGEDPLQFRRLWEKLYSYVEWWGRRGLGIFAISAIDTALLDIAGKYYGVPASVLLGGSFRNEVAVYASLLFDMDDPDRNVEKAMPYVKNKYFGVKFGWGLYPEKPFGSDMEKDERIVRAIRDGIGDEVKLMIDVGRYVNWNYSYALKMARILSKYDIYWLEEPLPQEDIYGLQKLTRESGVTIAGGEGYQTIYDFHLLLKNNALSLYQPDPSKLGGLSEAKRVIDLIELYNVAWVPHNWSTIVNTAASLQLIASSKNGYLIEHKQERNPLLTEISSETLEVIGGKMKIPTGPGLGVRIKESSVEKFSFNIGEIQ
ncbi:MAG: mandelate racemase/muconate lactonizing enzyme family protein [Thermoplasmatales archaeon]